MTWNLIETIIRLHRHNYCTLNDVVPWYFGFIVPILLRRDKRRVFSAIPCLKNIENMVIDWATRLNDRVRVSPRIKHGVKDVPGVDRNASAPITMAERWQRTLSEICLGRTAYRMPSRPHKCIYFTVRDGASAPWRTRRRWRRRSFISVLY